MFLLNKSCIIKQLDSLRFISIITGIGIMVSKKKKISSEIETELQCKATASLDGEVIDDLSAEDKSMAEFFKELGELGEDEQE